MLVAQGGSILRRGRIVWASRTFVWSTPNIWVNVLQQCLGRAPGCRTSVMSSRLSQLFDKFGRPEGAAARSFARTLACLVLSFFHPTLSLLLFATLCTEH